VNERSPLRHGQRPSVTRWRLICTHLVHADPIGDDRWLASEFAPT